MTANTETRLRLPTDVNAGKEVSRFTFNAGMAMAALIGLWGVACLVSGFMCHGGCCLSRGLARAILGL
jgi:diphthamide synthase subunit DPH2